MKTAWLTITVALASAAIAAGNESAEIGEASGWEMLGEDTGWLTSRRWQPLGAEAAMSSSLEGAWQGVLEVAGAKLRLVLKISTKPDGTLTATLDSVDQGARDIPVDEVTFKGETLRFAIKNLAVMYEGKLSGAEIVGQFKQGGITLPLTLRKTDKPPEVRRPQTPQKPYPYVEEEVSYENKKAGVKLAGTLTLPTGKGPFPAALLITGSGAQDRDETVFGHKPFWVLADYLTRRGIAVLRVDDRGVGGSTGNVAEATSEDLAEDVLAGVAYLKGRREINPKRIGLIGHSEGGLIAPIAASKSKDVAFIVLMAGTGLTGEEIIYRQSELLLKAHGAHILDIAAQRRVQEKMFAVVRAEPDNSRAEKKLREILAEEISQLSEAEKKAAGSASAALEAQVKEVLSPWFRFFLTYDPKPTLRKVKCPVLALNGEKDLQVPPQENLRAIADALKAGGNRDYTIKEFPGLNHLFQTCQTGAPSEYAQIEETIAPVVLETIASWILQRTRRLKFTH
ncbi:MAG: alpha/beta fold hydrolase [Abditibacteriales bacterium]|nr:alpha/beta fold hydrolase [Abditibacteriales bacterium]MDW8368007.1 alpha/beta fold hydrolase [Abditibacteriales bacterium]